MYVWFILKKNKPKKKPKTKNKNKKYHKKNCNQYHLTQKFQHKFHRYRCDNPNCKQIFTPSNLKRTRNLQWWKSDYYRRPENNGSELLVCTECEQTQKLEWFWTFTAALMDCDTIEERCKLYAAIERADKQLVDTHELKVALARQLVEQCLLIHRGMLGNLCYHFFFYLFFFFFVLIFIF